MRDRFLLAAVVGALSWACATQKQEQVAPDVTPPPPPKQVRITNYNAFDLGTCFPAPIDVPKVVTPEVITGLLLTARADLDECMVDPAHRGQSGVTRAVLGATVDATGVQVMVGGEGLTPGAKDCLASALNAHLSKVEPLPATAKPVHGEIDYFHDAANSPAVTLGVNEASDVVATLRIAERQWCDCFAVWRDRAPTSFEGQLQLAQEDATPPVVTFPPGADADTAQVQACVAKKIEGTKLAHTGALTVPLKFVFLHSGISEPLPGAPADLAVLQLEGLRTHNRAAEQLALGGRAAAANAWNATVTRYSANPRAFTMKQLRAGCTALEDADRALVTTQERFRADEQRALDWMRAQDPSGLAEPIAAAEQELVRLATALETSQAQLAQDSAGCAKVK
ncbi:MAG: hypothetical protein IRZ16_23090 [Myxococcaceae bacterium]|nr:hypothetical protein [Myxococcaceae bacterium]